MVTQLHKNKVSTFIPNRFYKYGIMEKRDKLGAVVLVQNCACEDESEGVESLW